MPLPESQNSPADTRKHDMDWSQIRETVQMLNLAIAQIVHTLQDGDESITSLGNSFTVIVGNVEMARSAAVQLMDSPEKNTILDNCRIASTQIQQAIVAFQFYDRISQRLSHVANSLNSLGNLVSDPERLNNPYEWNGLQEKIKSRYTLETERQMFEAILNGATVDEAMQLVSEIEKNTPEDEIEMF